MRSSAVSSVVCSSALAVVGVLAALRHRDATGEGQHVDIAMLDSMVALTDIVTSLWSLGLRSGEPAPLIMHGFRAADGWFVLQVGREPQLAALAELVGEPGWLSDPRLAEDRKSVVEGKSVAVRVDRGGRRSIKKKNKKQKYKT